MKSSKLGTDEAREKAEIEAEEVKQARKAEEKARKEAEWAAKEKAKREAIEARERAKREAEEVKQAKEAEEKARKEAERLAKEKAKREAIEAKERAEREAEEAKQVKKEAEWAAKEKAEREAEEVKQARKVEEKAKKEAEWAAKEKAKIEAIEAKEKAKREAEEARKAKEKAKIEAGEVKQARKAIEAELIGRLKSGDPDAVAQIFNAYVDRVYSLVFNQVDRDHEAAQDIVQETFLAAAKSAKYFQGRSNISTWLCSIANRKVADFYRRKKRETKHRVNYSIDTEQVQDRGESAVGLVESGESREIVRQALFSLPLHYRQVLIMKYVEGIPVSEIGTIMERSPKSVEGLLTRARKELQTKLTTQSEG